MSVIRIKKTENFVILHKGALEDPSLSFKAKGLWAYCMSRPNDWVFHVNHLAKVSQDGEDAIYTAIDELIEFGYCTRNQKNNGKFEKMEYIIREIPTKIKEILPQPTFPDAESPLAENPALLSIDLIPSIEEKNKSKKDGHSADATALSEIFFKKIKEKKPNYTQKITPKWHEWSDKLLKLRTKEELKLVMDFAFEDPWWVSKMLDIGRLLRHLDSLELVMSSKTGQATGSTENNKNIALRIKKMYPSHSNINHGNEYIEFVRGQIVNHIKFSDHGFVEQVRKNMEILNLKF